MGHPPYVQILEQLKPLQEYNELELRFDDSHHFLHLFLPIIFELFIY